MGIKLLLIKTFELNSNCIYPYDFIAIEDTSEV